AAERVAEMLDVEPAPRLVSPLAYDSKTKLFVLFGGDHGDYLMNDTWTFDPATTRWTHRNPKTAPAPRGNHSLKANGDGTVTLAGGHYYTSSTDYVGAQYKQFADGDWTYDIAADVWKGSTPGETPDIRVYRKGPYVPEFFWTGPAPDPKATAKAFAELPANRWVEMKDAHQPRMERTWGHAVLDPDGDRILVFGGGHSAHGGSDVLHFHLSTCRWELPFAVEFPLGQLYSNTSYPEGFNINGRPWVTGHTYQNYNYDLVTQKMYFAGHHHECYVYDPDKGDWTGRIPKPKGMTYDSCFYTLNLTQTPLGLYCWTGRGEMFSLVGKDWQPMPTTGVKLPTSSVDSSTYVYDSKRDRFLFFRADYGKPFSGEITALDRKTAVASKLAPKNLDAFVGRKVTDPFDRAVYDPEHDLVLFATYVPGDPATVRRTVAYDCAGDRWVTLNLDYAIEGKRALQPRGPGHSCGLMFDARRKLLWGCDTHSCRVYALRFDPMTADMRPIE
ncbi:MAG TPA: kelch repeat-containing protein, partial [Gemmataceae bacterium]|nr:kelch repeat-containing protein [Gemmataceae bacterium]